MIEMEAFSQNRSRYISFRETPDVSGGYKFRKAVPIFGGSANITTLSIDKTKSS